MGCSNVWLWQVRVVQRKVCEPLEEDSFRPILHHYDGAELCLELSIHEVFTWLNFLLAPLCKHFLLVIPSSWTYQSSLFQWMNRLRKWPALVYSPTWYWIWRISTTRKQQMPQVWSLCGQLCPVFWPFSELFSLILTWVASQWSFSVSSPAFWWVFPFGFS